MGCQSHIRIAPHFTSLTVFNTYGQLIYKETESRETCTVNCTEWPAGMYILKVELPNGQILSRKLTITR